MENTEEENKAPILNPAEIYRNARKVEDWPFEPEAYHTSFTVNGNGLEDCFNLNENGYCIDKTKPELMPYRGKSFWFRDLK